MSGHEPTFVKVLETSSQTDIAIIKSALEGVVEYYIRNENVAATLPYLYAALMVAEDDVPRVTEILSEFRFNIIGLKTGSPQ